MLLGRGHAHADLHAARELLQPLLELGQARLHRRAKRGLVGEALAVPRRQHAPAAPDERLDGEPVPDGVDRLAADDGVDASQVNELLDAPGAEHECVQVDHAAAASAASRSRVPADASNTRRPT